MNDVSNPNPDPFVQRCTQVQAEGERRFGEKSFREAIDVLAKNGGVDQNTMNQVLARPDAAEVIYNAGKHHPNRSDADWYAERAREKAESRGRPWSPRR